MYAIAGEFVIALRFVSTSAKLKKQIKTRADRTTGRSGFGALYLIATNYLEQVSWIVSN